MLKSGIAIKEIAFFPTGLYSRPLRISLSTVIQYFNQ